MNKYIELNNNLENLKLTRIKEILPVTLDSLKNEDKSLVDVLYELTKSEIGFRDEAIYEYLKGKNKDLIRLKQMDREECIKTFNEYKKNNGVIY